MAWHTTIYLVFINKIEVPKHLMRGEAGTSSPMLPFRMAREQKQAVQTSSQKRPPAVVGGFNKYRPQSKSGIHVTT